MYLKIGKEVNDMARMRRKLNRRQSRRIFKRGNRKSGRNFARAARGGYRF